MDEKLLKKIGTGTTTVGLVGKDAVVIAADKRATMGYYIASKDIEKIMPISKYMAMTVAGSVGDAQALVRWMKLQVRDYELEYETSMPTKAAAILLSNLLSAYKYMPFWVQLLLAGFDEKPRLFNIDMVGGLTEEKKTATGSGSPIAIGVIERGYKEGMDKKELVELAVQAIWAATQRDAASGEGIDVAVITKNGFSKIKKNDIDAIISSFQR